MNDPKPTDTRNQSELQFSGNQSYRKKEFAENFA